MQPARRCLVLALFLAFFVLPGCSTTTSVTGVWKKSDYNNTPFESILVVGLTKNNANKFLWENKMATLLRQAGVKNAITTLNAFPNYRQESAIDIQEIIDYVTKNNIEGVLITRLVDTTKETVYQPRPGNYYAGSYQYYRNYRHYYSRARVHVKGINVTKTTLLLETNLYQVKDQELVWSLASETIQSGNVGFLIDSVSQKVLGALKKDRLI